MHRMSWGPRRLGLAVIFGSLLLASSVFAQEETEPPVGIRSKEPSLYALHGATIVVSPGKTIENGVLVVDGEKIIAVGPMDSTKIPADAHKIDVSGKMIYPGFIDAFSEVEIPITELEGGAPYWNSNIRPQLQVSENVPAADDQDGKLRGTGIGARLVAPAGGIIKGTSSVVLTSDEATQRRLVEDSVALHIRLTVTRGFGGGGPSYPNSPMGAVALARQAMLDGQWYQAAWSAAEADSKLSRPERNDALAALEPYLSGNGLVVLDGLNELYALRADRYAREFALRAAIRGSGNEYRRLDEIAATGRPVILPINFPQPPDVATPETAANASLETLMHWDLAPENPGRLANAGVKICLTSDGLRDPKEFLASIRKAIKRGLSAQDALAAITVNPAQLYEVDNLLGTLDTGKLANIVIADGDLFEGKGKIEETWVAGKRFELETDPLRTPAGHWKVEISQGDGKPSELLIELKTARGDKLSGQILPEEGDAIDLKDVSVSDTQVTAMFPTKSLGDSGMARLSAVLTQTKDGDETIDVGMGAIVWGDGSRSTIRMVQVPKPEPKADDKAEEAKEEPKTDADETKEGEGKEAETKEEDESEKSAADEAKSDSAKAPKQDTHSFDVNYPLGAYGVDKPSRDGETVVFQNATVWTNGDSGILKETDVLVKGGKIAAVGTDLEVPEGATVVDATGMHLTPGIIDCHSHMATDGGVNESGQTVTAEVRIGDFIDCDDMTIYRQLAGGVTSSNILHGSANPIGGQNQVIKLRWGLNDEEMKFDSAPLGIKFALGENVKRQPRSGEGTYPRTRMGVEQIIRDEFQAAKEYAARHAAWQKQHTGLPPRRDLELEAIAEILAHERWIHCHSYRQDEILALIRTLDDYNITIGTFQHILEGYKVADAMAKHGAMASAFSDWWAYKIEVADAIPYAGALMHEAGVVVSFNSDDGELATHLNLEAAKAVKYGGVPAAEALKFVTLNPAKQLRIDDKVGSIEVGKDADVVLWSGDPLSNFTRCEQTWIDGICYFDRSEDQAAREKVAQMRNTLIQKILDSGESMRAPGQGDDDPSRLWPREDLFCHGHDHDVEEHFMHDHDMHEHSNHEQGGHEHK